jgi:methionine-S-sulfoxide reductase
MSKGTAIIAAGCFWGVQYYFDQVPGIVSSQVGYIGGNVDNPTYEMVCAHKTGHSEAVKIIYDDEKVSYKTLLKQFFRMHDPTQLNRQGPDIGDNYRSAIFYLNDNQRDIASKIVQEVDKSGVYVKPIVTTIEKAGTFWPAEEYHQKFTERTGRGVCNIAYRAV